ncbi:MAG TPA: ABC transporter substrate-binding protein [Methylomusa anaerophila]|uniref:ABC transporter substrate-binding protein n=1 Tax=Methylomusa anaerophila TaxID=1930071 RepID=UPI002C0B652A|nr:ABC transporter substrate-binding protein [Methylomusa anaerophila]HML90469.1 ABC transporter substrate-binding protein [Methylomusa anaerophila]
MIKKIFWIILAAAVILLLGGCNGPETTENPADSPAANAAVKDSAGREIKMPANLKRVIVLNSSAFNMITAIGAADTIIGVNDSTQKSEAAAAGKEAFGSFMQPYVEKIIAAGPDAVIVNSMMNSTQVKQLEDAGITVISLEFYLPSILQDEIVTLGKLFNREAQAQKYADFIMKYRNLIESRVKDIRPENKVAVYFEGYSEYSTVARGSGGDELVTGAGGINIAGRETVKYPKVSAEWVLEKKPQVVVKTISSNSKAMGEGFTDKTAVQAVYDGIISRTGWNELAAVKNNKVLLLAQNIGTTPEGSIIGMLYMAKTMYPDKFADIDPYEVYKQMEKEFFNIDPKGIIVFP